MIVKFIALTCVAWRSTIVKNVAAATKCQLSVHKSFTKHHYVANRLNAKLQMNSNPVQFKIQSI